MVRGSLLRQQTADARGSCTLLVSWFLWAVSYYAVFGGVTLAADDWPMYGHDPARSHVTAQKLPWPLSAGWVFKALHPPAPAWGDPKPEPVEGILELRRVHFDDVFQPILGNGAVYFGSSADNKVYCLDAATGRIRWTVITGGPIRLAPTLCGGRVYVGSDDGFAYCLKAEDGAVLWKFRAAPEDRRVLGHGRMISLWPLRTGILVDGGVAYFGAGIFPAEGVFLFAVDAATGRLLWCNDTCGEAPQSGISPQGYLLASPTTLYVPMGRVSPAAFDRQNGKLLNTTYFGKPVGGTYALLAGEEVFTGTEEMVGYRRPKDAFAWFAGRRLVVASESAYVATDKELSALDRQRFPAASRRLRALESRITDVNQKLSASRKLKSGTPAQQQEYALLEKQKAALTAELPKAQADFAATARWKIPCECHEALILAGDALVAGGQDQVVAVAANSGEILWSARVDGAAKGLAAAGDRLVVSTDKGRIYCFAPAAAAQGDAVSPAVDPGPFASSPLAALFAQAADQILTETKIRGGYCLVLGLETGQLALELAKRSELMVYAVSPDAEKVAAARKAIDSAGYYGARVCVEQWPLENVPYADYFANLIVSETAIARGELPAPSEIARMLKPLGGTVYLAPPGPARASLGRSENVRRLIEHPQLVAASLGKSSAAGAASSDAGEVPSMLVRGPLVGAGNWTHLYANVGNTACGDDKLVRCPLGVLWFGQPGPGQMVNRHHRAAGPLVVDGRMFVQGENVVMAYDAYNGVKLWQRDIPGALRANASHDGGNLAANAHGLFVALGNECLRLDPATGETLRRYPLPASAEAKPGRWGYLACTDTMLYGSRGTAPVFSQSLFAYEIESGKLCWTYQGESFSNISVSQGDGRVFLVDAGLRTAVALDSQTGQVVWRQAVDLTDCGGGGGTATMYGDGVLVVFGVYLDGHYWQQFFAGQFAGRKVLALSGQDGRLLWSQAVGYRVRPLILSDTLHVEPWALDLHTGAPKTRLHPVTGQPDRWQFARPGHHCGLPVASPHALFFRSHCFGYYDLDGDYGTMHFGAQRPGCWINFIPAAGLLLFPEASAGCMCPFPNMCSVAFQPVAKNKAYAFYSAPGPMTPVRHLAINFGAAGDRRDHSGTLWLGFPRPAGSLVLRFNTPVAFYPAGTFVQRNSAYTPIAGTEDPWLFTSAACGLKRCEIPLLDEGDGAALYRVRLAFADPENDQPGRRVFDIKLQNKVVLAGFDPVKDAGGRDHAVVKQFDGVEVQDSLVIELLAKSAHPEPFEAPILQGVEVIRQRVTSLGCRVPDWTVSETALEQTGQLRLANIRDEPFAGNLQVTAPAGFRIEPTTAHVNLASGQRVAIPLKLTCQRGVAAGKYPLEVKLLRPDGSVELARSASVEHLGRRARLVLDAAEDVSLQQRYPDTNKGTATVLLVDGGNASMGDADHALALIRFRLAVPGRPVAARLRITNAGNPSGDAGEVRLASEPWQESAVTYATRPKLGKRLGRIGPMAEQQTLEVPLDIDLSAMSELSVAIEPTSCDGVDYLSRESGTPPQLVIEYVPDEQP